MEGLKLNNAPAALFVGNSNDERKDLVAGGRLILSEAHGRKAAEVRGDKFETRLNDAEYRETNEKLTQRTMLFCAKIAAAARGEDAPQTYNEFLKGGRKWASDPNFLRCLQGITSDVIAPMLPYTTSDALGALAFVDKVGIGQTYEVNVLSNDIFLFQDSSWGASRSVPKNSLYSKSITINPKPRSAAAKIKWYQLVGNEQGGADIGRYYLALAGGSNNKILALWNGAMTAGVSNSAFVPTYLKKSGYNTANWIALAKAVSQANGLPRESIIAYGDWAALSKVLPSGTAQDAALTYGLGPDWFSKGFLGTCMGVPLAPIQNTYVAGQVNLASPTEMLSANTIYMLPRAGEGFAPVYIIFEDDPIVLEMSPDQTGDMTIDINMTISVEAKGVFGSKIGVMSSIS
ncbi:MAG: hypothetical protein J6W09_04665 [Bacteroidales bacterium]|nr:hypothetical protein [Bacteroidales bacterium]